MPTTRPPSRARPTMTSGAKSFLTSNHEPASMTWSMTSYMSKYLRWSYGTISSIGRPGFGSAISRAGAASRKDLDLLRDPAARGVDQIQHRGLQARRPFLDAHDLEDRLLAPRAGLHGVVVGHDADGAPADGPDAGHDAIRRDRK